MLGLLCALFVNNIPMNILFTVKDRGRPASSKACSVLGWDTMKGILQNHVYAAAGILIHRPCNPGCRDAIHDVFGLHEKRK